MAISFTFGFKFSLPITKDVSYIILCLEFSSFLKYFEGLHAYLTRTSL